MGKTVYSKCVEMLKEIPKGERITLKGIEKLIIINIGGDSRTLKTAIKTMLATGLLIDIAANLFEVA